MKTYFLVVLMKCNFRAKVHSVYNILYKSKEQAEKAIKGFLDNYPENEYTVVPVEIPINKE